MINYDSILSAFDGKPTLLQWLKMVKKALEESVLKSVDITQNGEKVVFSFNFEDGTSIRTPEVTLPKGDKGDTGVGIARIETTGSQVVGGDTESIIRVELSDGSVKQFKTYAKNGSNGVDGVSITGIDTVGNEVVGDNTLTTLRAHYSNDTTGEFVVTAKNGKDAVENKTHLYLYNIAISDSSRNYFISFNAYFIRNDINLTLNDALKMIPDYSIGTDPINQIPVTLLYMLDKKGVVSVNKQQNSSNPFKFDLNIEGIYINKEDNSVNYIKTSFTANSVVTSYLGEIK